MKIVMHKKIPLLISLLLSGCADTGSDKQKLAGARIPAYTAISTVTIDEQTAKKEYIESRPVLTTWSSSQYPIETIGQNLSLNIDSLKKDKVFSLNSDKYSKITNPVISQKSLFMLDNSGVIKAIDLKTNKTTWENKDLTRDKALLKLRDSSKMLFGGMLYDNNTLFVTGGFKGVIALDSETGKMKWMKELSTIIRGIPTKSQNKLLIQGINNNVYALNIETGDLIWSYLGSKGSDVSPLDPPLLVATSTSVVSAQAGNELNAIDIDTGSPIWRYTFYELYGNGSDLLTVAPNQIQIAEYKNSIYAVHPNGKVAALHYDGTPIWETNLTSGGTFWISGALMFLSTQDENIIAIDTNTGKVKWIKHILQFTEKKKHKKDKVRLIGRPIVADGMVLLVTSDGLLHKLDYNTGNSLGHKNISKSPIAPAIIANNELFLIVDKGVEKFSGRQYK